LEIGKKWRRAGRASDSPLLPTKERYRKVPFFGDAGIGIILLLAGRLRLEQKG
jgi:hypothetical protein